MTFTSITSEPTPMPKPCGKIESKYGVIPEKAEKQNREVEKIAMQVLQNERKRRLAAILAARRLADRAGGWIEKKRAVVGFAIVITSRAKTERAAENQDGRGKRPPMVLRVDQGGIERRDIRSPFVEFPFERPERGV